MDSYFLHDYSYTPWGILIFKLNLYIVKNLHGLYNSQGCHFWPQNLRKKCRKRVRAISHTRGKQFPKTCIQKTYKCILMYIIYYIVYIIINIHCFSFHLLFAVVPVFCHIHTNIIHRKCNNKKKHKLIRRHLLLINRHNKVF